VHATACEFIIFVNFFVLLCFVLVFWFWVWFLEAGGALTIDLGKLHSILLQVTRSWMSYLNEGQWAELLIWRYDCVMRLALVCSPRWCWFLPYHIFSTWISGLKSWIEQSSCRIADPEQVETEVESWGWDWYLYCNRQIHVQGCMDKPQLCM